MKSSTVGDQIKPLIATCIDGHQGYQIAASHATHRELKQQFRKLSAQRKEFAAQLMDQLGFNPHAHGTLKGAFHRGWMEFRDKMGALTTPELVSECVRGEVAAIKHYEEVLHKPMQQEMRDIVAEQLAQIVEAHGHLTELGT